MRFLLTSIIALVSSPLIHAASSATGYLHPARSLFSRSALHKRFASNNSHVQVDGAVCTVTAIGGGEDDGPNLLYAFNLCNTDALINLPSYYQVDTVLNTYLHNVEVRLTGGIAYKPDIAYWSPNSIYLTYQNATTYWFFSGDSVTFHGGGTIDANGQTWWDYFALNPNAGVAGGSSRTFARPIPLTVGNASNIVVQDISIINSPFWTNFVYQSKNITYDSIRIRALSSNASAPAANSDGWDIYRSDSVTISNSNIVNDDDCVSFKPNCTNMLVENLVCNGSHGVSVGSLGQYYGEGKPILPSRLPRLILSLHGSRHRGQHPRPQYLDDERPERGAHQGLWRIERYALSLWRWDRLREQRHLPGFQQYQYAFLFSSFSLSPLTHLPPRRRRQPDPHHAMLRVDACAMRHHACHSHDLQCTFHQRGRHCLRGGGQQHGGDARVLSYVPKYHGDGHVLAAAQWDNGAVPVCQSRERESAGFQLYQRGVMHSDAEASVGPKWSDEYRS